MTRPGNRVARISPLVPGVDLVGTVVGLGRSVAVTRRAGSSSTATTSAWPTTAASPQLGPGPGRVGGPPARRPRRPPGRHHRHGGLHRRALPPPARTPGPVAGDGPVLVTGASGGVGSMAVALLASRGYEVVASTGKAAEGRLPDRPRRGRGRSTGTTSSSRRTGRSGPERWAGAVDCVGGATLAAVLRTLRYGAAVAASGLTGGNTLETSVYPFIVRDVTLIGVDTVLTPIDERRRVWARDGHGLPRPPCSTTWSARIVDLDEVWPPSSTGSRPAGPGAGRWCGPVHPDR